jgi:hypothetical protein
MSTPDTTVPTTSAMWLTLCYSIVFVAAYWIFALAIAWVVLNNSISTRSGYGVMVACLAAYVLGWVFARRNQRVFTGPEMMWSIFWCSVWMLLFEAAAYLSGWSVITYQELIFSLPAAWRPFIVLLGFVLNVYVLSFVLRKHVLKMMKNRIKVSA